MAKPRSASSAVTLALVSAITVLQFMLSLMAAGGFRRFDEPRRSFDERQKLKLRNELTNRLHCWSNGPRAIDLHRPSRNNRVMGALAKRFGIYLAGWTIATFFYCSQDLAQRLYRGSTTPWRDVLIPWFIGNLACVGLTPLVLWSGRRWPLTEGSWKSSIAIQLLVTACLATLAVGLETPILLWSGILSPVLQSKSLPQVFGAIWVYGFHSDCLTYWIVLGLQAGARYYREFQHRRQQALRLELQLSDARLSALKMQLQPHFLFNTLSAIIVLVRQHKSLQAEDTLSKLSDLLRRVLSDSDAQEVPLRRELEFIEMYLAIEQVRFQDRLTVHVFSDADVLDAAVPHLGLQPIVENAVRHGLGGSLGSVRIDFHAERRGDQLQLRIHDDGPGFPQNGKEHKGIGLTNTRARLQQLYGDAAQLKISNGIEQGATVTITLPFRLATGEARCA